MLLNICKIQIFLFNFKPDTKNLGSPFEKTDLSSQSQPSKRLYTKEVRNNENDSKKSKNNESSCLITNIFFYFLYASLFLIIFS